MFSTCKEVHVYLENAIQNIASNRKQSIQPRFLDMVLNNAVPTYIKSKFPDKTTDKDIESTLARYTSFNRLKKTLVCTPEYRNELRTSYVIKLPSDCLKLQTAGAAIVRPSVSPISIPKYSTTLTFDESQELGDVLSFSYSITRDITKEGTIECSDLINNVSSIQGYFYIYDHIIDRLEREGFDITYTSLPNKRVIRIDYPIGTIPTLFTSKNPFVEVVTDSKVVKIAKQVATNYTKSVSILSSFEVGVALDDYYGSRNLYLNPVADMINDEVCVYTTDFSITKLGLVYIRKPILFDISTGAIPEIEIDKEFLDYAVKELHLILNSPAYREIVNEQSKNL